VGCILGVKVIHLKAGFSLAECPNSDLRIVAS